MKYQAVVLFCGVAFGQVTSGYHQNGNIKLEIKDFSPELSAKLHAKICAHGPTKFCGPLFTKHDQTQIQETRIPKDAKPGKYCFWIEYDGGETELRNCCNVFPPDPPTKKSGQK